ncbi:hypothetical protein BDP55DRAFT_543397 [Colletotrichum godetiae]|uniref:Uncharacterized protein n=1 Tax=Colletotrichum godetiae TaxID=1209918 RepID=A0AAJ0AWW0_9PEZI|nr:uncharacterized protein BDP55DRAFT_543397 [Colletotrichum godetiae]KAK1691082.1 hypothetical protein BDP55DRAFT_543397 [Colletotrichum godetiae]
MLEIVTSTSTECDRDLHYLKTRLLCGAPPMSIARWRQRGLHELDNIQRACQHLCAVVDAFEYLNLPHNEARMRKACNSVWNAGHDFEKALNAYRRQKGRGSPVSVTALWEEYIVDFFDTVAARAHAWVMARIGELKEALLLQLRQTTPVSDGPASAAQMEILDRFHDLTEITNKADTKIMVPLWGYTLRTLTSAAPRLRDDWNGYDGREAMKAYPYDMRFRSRIYGIRCRYLSRAAQVQRAMENVRLGREVLPMSDPTGLEATCRAQMREYEQARRELRGVVPEVGDEPWIAGVKGIMRTAAHRPFRVWGFIGYRVSYEHSDEEWKAFLGKFRDDVTAWGEGVDGAGDLKPMCKLRWIDGREHGIPEGDIEAAKRHYGEYSKSPACEGFMTLSGGVFLVADKASIDSYLHPVKDDAEPIIPHGDLGPFVLVAKPDDEDREDRASSSRGRGPHRDVDAAGRPTMRREETFDGTVRVLGAVLFDDVWALLSRNSVKLPDLAQMAQVHPRQVYVGPNVPLERDGWRTAGEMGLVVFNSLEKWKNS